MGTLLKDLQLSLRMFLKSPGFTITAVTALALGIGTNTGIFSVVNTVLLKPLAYPDPDRIVQFMLTTPARPVVGGSATVFNIWRQQSGAFQDVSAYRLGTISLTGGLYPEEVPLAQASADCLRLFGAPIEQGRAFTEEEDQPGGEHVVVITDELWRRRFGADTRIIGKPILLSGQPYTVTGILGPGFDFDSGPRPDVWIPLQIDPQSRDQAHYFSVAGRLKPGVTVAKADAQLQLAYAQFRRMFPNYAGMGNGFSVERIQDRIVGDVRPSLLILSGAVGLVLLIACTNVANLLLIRATSRRREIAVRVALGASRGRIVRQLMTESIMLAVAGGGLGLAFGILGVRFLLAVNSANIPRLGQSGSEVTLDGRVLAFTVLISLITGVLFGLVPALQASRSDQGFALKEGGGRSGTGLRQNRTRSILVMSETALAVILLVGSALLIRSFIALRGVNPGFDPHNVLTLRTSLTGTRFNHTPAVAQLVQDAVRRIDALPGVVAVSSATALPLEGSSGLPFDKVSHPLAGGAVRVGWTSISPGYFDVFKIPILRGRAFAERDDHGAASVVIINQAMARKFWPNADPVGELITIGKGYAPGFDEPARQIVGIASDIHEGELNRYPLPMLYVPIPQVAEGITALFSRVVPLAFAVRTRVEPHSLISSIENEIRQASAELPIAEVRSMDEISVRSTSRQDFNMLLMTIFGASALLLAAIGIYGLLAYSVKQRTQEIGIRLALGADTGQVRNMVVLQGMRLALAGLATGMIAAFGLARLLQSFLFEVRVHDPVVFTAVPVVLCVVTFLAVWLPASRAARIDPAIALRSE